MAWLTELYAAARGGMSLTEADATDWPDWWKREYPSIKAIVDDTPQPRSDYKPDLLPLIDMHRDLGNMHLTKAVELIQQLGSKE